jgi:hypothetical protein
MTVAGYNVRVGGGVSGKWWSCDEHTIEEMPSWNPSGTSPYKTFSTFYGSGHGFWVLRGDATNPPNNEGWHHLRFDHHPTNYSSSLSNAGQEAALRCQPSNVWWPHMLLPCIYHGPPYDYEGYGGLTGDLPIFLSLLALSMKPEMLGQELPNLMQNGSWTTHQNAHGRKPTTMYMLPYRSATDSNRYGQERRHRVRVRSREQLSRTGRLRRWDPYKVLQLVHLGLTQRRRHDPQLRVPAQYPHTTSY